MRFLWKMALALALVVASFTLATPAFASYGCPAGYICFYSGYNGTGAMFPAKWSQTGCKLMPDGMDDATRSIQNSTTYNYHVFVSYTNDICNESGATWSTVWAGSSGNMAGVWVDTITRYERN